MRHVSSSPCLDDHLGFLRAHYLGNSVLVGEKGACSHDEHIIALAQRCGKLTSALRGMRTVSLVQR